MGSARRSRRLRIGALAGLGALLAAAVVVTTHSGGSATDPVITVDRPVMGFKTIGYLGHGFAVPTGWRVVDLATHPTACIRFDVHAIYLGTPGPRQDCPARGVGRRTGAILIRPVSSPRGAYVRTVAVERPESAEIDVLAPGISVTASYGADDRSSVLAVLSAAQLPSPVVEPAPDLPAPDVAGLPTGATGIITGVGFDACTAPSSDQMSAWTAPASPFTAIGIYFGGSERACAQSNLTASWISAESRAGWHFMPLYVGWQAAWDSLTQTPPAVLGQQSADDAVVQAAVLGFGPGSVLYYDMEAYSTAAEGAAAMAFLSAWSAELHQKGYRAAAYSSESSGISDLVANLGKITEPDVIDVANWNGNADGDPAATPSGSWTHLRVHQYQGGADATYGGVKINIDRDFFDLHIA
jgi:Domain of unknown function (DUF1906)